MVIPPSSFQVPQYWFNIGKIREDVNKKIIYFLGDMFPKL